jgi:tRNA pseudouridine38-40 synthase
MHDAGAILDARSAAYEVASRTDRGVSAWGNVFAVDTDLDPRSLVHEVRTVDGLWLLAARAVATRFSPRRACVGRAYGYFLDHPSEFNWTRMREASKEFVGVHDFVNFCRRDEGVPTRRRIDRIRLGGRGAQRVLRFEAPNFLWEQIRRIVHGLDAVGRGERTVRSVKAQLRGSGSPEAPASPEPLVLETAKMPFEFAPVSKSMRNRIQGEADRAWAAHRFYAGFSSSLPTMRR